VHGACGAWGLLAASLFSTDYYVAAVTGTANAGGAFYGSADKLGAALVLIVCTVAWTSLLSSMMFLTLRSLGVLRAHVSPEPAPGGTMMDGSRHLGAPYDPDDASLGANALFKSAAELPHGQTVPPPAGVLAGTSEAGAREIVPVAEH